MAYGDYGGRPSGRRPVGGGGVLGNPSGQGWKDRRNLGRARRDPNEALVGNPELGDPARQRYRELVKDTRRQVREEADLPIGQRRAEVRSRLRDLGKAQAGPGTMETTVGQRPEPAGGSDYEDDGTGTSFRSPYRPGMREKEAEVQRLRDLGLRGLSLRGGLNEWRKNTREMRRPLAAEDFEEVLPDSKIAPYVNKTNFMERLLSGNEPMPPIETIAGVRATRNLFGYNEPQDQLQESLLSDLGEENAGVDLKRELSPTLNQASEYAAGASPDADLMYDQRKTLPDLSAYARERLAEGGLTPQEEDAIRRRGRGAVESSYSQSTADEGSRMAAAGMDPRSGMAAQRAMQLQRARERGTSGVEAGITEAELARKSEIENLARGTAGLEEEARLGDVRSQLSRLGQYESMLGQYAGLEEGARWFDVATPLERQAQLENRLMDLSSLSESQRLSDLGYSEGMRQARKSRSAQRDAAEKLMPGLLEKAGAVIGGLAG